ncbi:hypothetical protein MSG28_000195, partial [Choristoneura fumiferana]
LPVKQCEAIRPLNRHPQLARIEPRNRLALQAPTNDVEFVSETVLENFTDNSSINSIDDDEELQSVMTRYFFGNLRHRHDTESHSESNDDPTPELHTLFRFLTDDHSSSSYSRPKSRRKKSKKSKGPPKESSSVNNENAAPSTNVQTDPPTNGERRLGDCPICMENLARGSIASTTCGHVFCLDCIKTCLRTNGKKCPTCRKTLKGVAIRGAYKETMDVALKRDSDKNNSLDTTIDDDVNIKLKGPGDANVFDNLLDSNVDLNNHDVIVQYINDEGVLCEQNGAPVTNSSAIMQLITNYENTMAVSNMKDGFLEEGTGFSELVENITDNIYTLDWRCVQETQAEIEEVNIKSTEDVVAANAPDSEDTPPPLRICLGHDDLTMLSDADIRLRRLNSEPTYLTVVYSCNHHDHPLDAQLFNAQPHSRRLPEHIKEEIKDLLFLGAKSDLLRKYVTSETGLRIYDKYFHNVRVKMTKDNEKRQLTEERFEALTQKLKDLKATYGSATKENPQFKTVQGQAEKRRRSSRNTSQTGTSRKHGRLEKRLKNLSSHEETLLKVKKLQESVRSDNLRNTFEVVQYSGTI